MGAYVRTTVVDASPAADTVKTAVLDLDTDLTGVVGAYNAHDTATTSVHGFTGAKTGSGAMVGATSPTISNPTFTGTITGLPFSTAPEVTAGLEAAKAIAPDVLTAALAGAANRITGRGATGGIKGLTGAEAAVILAGALTANSKMFVNAAGTGLEWANGRSTTAHTYDLATASGTQTLAGAGFPPTKATIQWGIGGTTDGVGYCINGTNFMKLNRCGGTAYSGVVYSSRALWPGTDAGFVNNVSGVLVLNSDGGVITWTRTGSPTGTLQIQVIWER